MLHPAPATLQGSPATAAAPIPSHYGEPYARARLPRHVPLRAAGVAWTPCAESLATSPDRVDPGMRPMLRSSRSVSGERHSDRRYDVLSRNNWIDSMLVLHSEEGEPISETVSRGRIANVLPSRIMSPSVSGTKKSWS